MSRPEHSSSGSAARKVTTLLVLVVLLPMIAFLLYYGCGRSSGKAVLVEEYWEPYPDRLTQMGDNRIDSVDQAMIYYNEENYWEAYDALQALPGASTGGLLRLYSGISALGSDRTDRAIALLEGLRDEPGPVADHSRYYLALAYLQADRREEARQLLQQIVSDEGYLHQRAGALLDEL